MSYACCCGQSAQIDLLSTSSAGRSSGILPLPGRKRRTFVSDAWPLLAVVYASGDGRGANLRSIRFVTELIRDSDRTNEELGASLLRLNAAGLVHERDGKIFPSEPIRALFRARMCRRGVREDFERLVRSLRD
jgi:hypothetical protein